jgi:hypothetical protein
VRGKSPRAKPSRAHQREHEQIAPATGTRGTAHSREPAQQLTKEGTMNSSQKQQATRSQARKSLHEQSIMQLIREGRLTLDGSTSQSEEAAVIRARENLNRVTLTS